MVGLRGGIFRGGTAHYGAAGPVYGLAGNRHGGGPPAGSRDAPGERGEDGCHLVASSTSGSEGQPRKGAGRRPGTA